MDKLKILLVERFGLDPTATEDQAKSLALELVKDGKLSIDDMTKAMATPAEDPLARLEGIVQDAVQKAVAQHSNALDAQAKALAASVAAPAPAPAPSAPLSTDPNAMFREAPPSGSVRVIPATERYSTEKSIVMWGHGRHGAKHPWANRPMLGADNAPVYYSSERERAMGGAWLKVHLARQMGLAHLVSQHDMDLFKHALHELEFGGDIATQESPATYHVSGRKLTEIERKTIFGGSGDASGGQNLVAQVLENEIVRGALLNGEIAPFCTNRTQGIGTGVDVPTMVNLTVSSGTTESTSISAQSTAALLSKLSTTFFAAVGMLQVGRDFLQDITPNFMAEVMASYAEQLGVWLDNQVCNGDGTTEPLGIFVASGTTTIGQQSPSATGWDMTDVEALLFGIGKQYRKSTNPSVRYVMNDTNYARIRRLPLSSTDQRRLFGMTHEDYKLLERPVGIQNDIANAKAAFCDLSKYYLYRRQGMELRMTDQGHTLFAANTVDIVMRARYGGRPMLGEAFAILASAPN